MPGSEFDLIHKYFSREPADKSVILGVGDDAAVVAAPTNKQLVVTTDTFLAGRHFLPETPPYAIGYKSLAVNLSDLAAMSAEPKWLTLSLTIPDSDEAWLAEFARGFFSLADKFAVELIGGDTVRGQLSITMQAMGWVDKNQYLSRSMAKAGDLIYVSGDLGDAALALQLLLANKKISSAQEVLIKKLQRPEPRVSLGRKLVGIASAAIDISDGLTSDLGHILERSLCGAVIDIDSLPRSSVFLETTTSRDTLSLQLDGGDDYELCFTVPEAREHLLQQSTDPELQGCYKIGEIESTSGLRIRCSDGSIETYQARGFDHFGASV